MSPLRSLSCFSGPVEFDGVEGPRPLDQFQVRREPVHIYIKNIKFSHFFKYKQDVISSIHKFSKYVSTIKNV